MNKTYLAVLIGSLFVSATPAFADDVVYLQNGALDAAVSEDTTSLEFDVSSDNTIVMSADDGEEHVVSAADSFTIHHDAPRNSGSFIAKNGSTLTLSADTISLSLDHDVTDPWPNLVHAYGGTVNIEGGSSVTLTSTGDGGALMSQATVEGGASLLNITSGGDVSIHSSSSSVMAEMLQEYIEDARSLVTINAAGSVSITADSNAGILLVNQVVAAGWHGSPESRTG